MREWFEGCKRSVPAQSKTSCPVAVHFRIADEMIKSLPVAGICKEQIRLPLIP